ncbi:hypothetical protein TSOC_000779 [Tetrabaena socialis]|uniref:Uncharacterized protein n=1 Tax=Tetrabaena socialis TaxID=47790 RepID=A0A2J8AIF7_9CHLO|nr:hypothetical protein TSOC_000779 [Tetrabaena socialis]|eukprot:PNH12298.1 hypothetical protein TSOC_000779 [Tetrabaena socialis]
MAALTVDHHIATTMAAAAAAVAAAAAGAAGASAAAAGGSGAGAGAAGLPDPNSIVDDVEVNFPDTETKARVWQALRSNEVARRLLETFALERLARSDYLAAAKALCLLAKHLAPGCLAVEAADFAATLAGRLAELVKSRRLGPGSRLWLYAVDCLLVKSVDAHTQAHEEVLRLLLAAAMPTPDGRPPLLTPSEVDAYLKASACCNEPPTGDAGEQQEEPQEALKSKVFLQSAVAHVQAQPHGAESEAAGIIPAPRLQLPGGAAGPAVAPSHPSSHAPRLRCS